MKHNTKYLDLVFRRLKISDFKKFNKLFQLCFEKKISYNFFKWRYFTDKFSFCYGVFNSSNMIASVGMKSMKLNNNKNERIFSRHSSMVLLEYRGLKIFSRLLKEVKQKTLTNIKIIVTWPNQNNFASFGIDSDKIFKKKYYLYKTTARKSKLIQTSNCSINQLSKFKIFIQSSDNFFQKDFDYFKSRYLSYKKHEYLINKFELKKLKSFFILKRNNDKSGLNYVILDHFGSKHIKSKHFFQLIHDQQKVIFWSSRKIYKLNYKLIGNINPCINFTKKNYSKKNKELLNKDFMIGDTDSFITIN
jgi:hypothetical protein